MSYSKVIALAHPKNKVLSEFVRITATSDLEIQMTSNHLLLTCENGGDLTKGIKLVIASELGIGSCVVTKNGVYTVKSIEITAQRGVYSVITENDYIVVNGFIVSPFSDNHAIGSMYYDIHRFLGSYFPGILESETFKYFHYSLGNLLLTRS